jgi:sugar/nucleoside kinase (ribokinase family)
MAAEKGGAVTRGLESRGSETEAAVTGGTIQCQKPYRILAMGEILYEFFPRPMQIPLATADTFGGYAGGAPLNFAGVARRLGAEVDLLAVVGGDPFSQSLLGSLGAEGIDCSAVRQVDEAQIGLVFHDNSAEDTHLLFYRRAAAGTFLSPQDVTEEAIRAVDLVYFPGVALQIGRSAQEACLKAMDLAQKTGTRLAFDPNMRALQQGGEALELIRRVVGQADIVTPTANEAYLLTGEKDPRRAAFALREMGATIVAVTLEKQGCWLLTPTEVAYASAYCVETVEPTGAGDAFCAALSCGVLQGWPAARLAAYANAAGALAVAAIGHMGQALPTVGRIEELMAGEKYPPPE